MPELVVDAKPICTTRRAPGELLHHQRPVVVRGERAVLARPVNRVPGHEG